MELCFSPEGAVPTGISIEINPRLAELKDPSEDWTGVTSTAERRKLQNRLNQRARRRRTQANPMKNTPSNPSSEPDSGSDLSTVLVKSVPPVKNQNQLASEMRAKRHPELCRLETQIQLIRFAGEAYENYLNGNPRPAYLTTLVRVNVFYAFVQNARVLDFDGGWLTYEAISPFNKSGPGLGHAAVGNSCPENMRPTELQVAVEHHPWIDFFPHPRMRDNFLRIVAEQGEDYIDEDDLCRDIVDVGAGAGVEESALNVWGEAWDPRGWEATEPFLKKWGWLLAGCTDMLEGTNYWRQKRGLPKLRFNWSTL
ncbi:hypothetical protein CGRA01v4_10717 [Colletotrichum graminicola]|uniref:BZIP domain-containing protein n=1 Tax=Colletotrichum graminicola (strain M1.001 / M2 / FGSC 10212) TaxID=645133 RepID=E3QSJ1_COLGM|nr:uncharacterized protein GLRG_08973 [Colletotrichum graminicola M1.001]EFQ33829.1 hypothetical protein GLRG_08973 [Colletotrichum graminicola M1.001]WDK19430.1 hypothetical protein CGRA01v4_10717 [Colletotrichum graminicola]